MRVSYTECILNRIWLNLKSKFEPTQDEGLSSHQLHKNLLSKKIFFNLKII